MSAKGAGARGARSGAGVAVAVDGGDGGGASEGGRGGGGGYGEGQDGSAIGQCATHCITLQHNTTEMNLETEHTSSVP